MSARWRSTLRRDERRAKEFGEIKYEIVSPTPDTVGGLLTELFKVEMAGWKSRVGTALQTWRVLGGFYTAYSRAASERGMLRIAFLRINGEAAAAQLLVEHANRIWVLKVGYDEKFARCSPGILLMNEVIRHAFSDPVEAFEFLGTYEPWLDIWLHELRQYESYHMYPSALIALASRGWNVSSGAIYKIRSLMAKKYRTLPSIAPSVGSER